MQKPRKLPQRQCLGCREMKNKKDLIRAVRSPDPACLAKARKSRALERAFGSAIPPEVYSLLEEQMRDGSDG